jgi:hypothetical protein
MALCTFKYPKHFVSCRTYLKRSLPDVKEFSVKRVAGPSILEKIQIITILAIIIITTTTIKVPQ